MAKGGEQTAPAKGGLKPWLVVSVLGLAAIGAGFSLPLYFLRHQPQAKTAVPRDPSRQALITFGDVVVNLGEERLTRYLRAKLLLVVEESQQKDINELMQKQKPFLKNWLISYLSDLSMQDVTGTAGVNRVRREIRDQFNAMLFPDGAEKIVDILFDEFVVQ